MKHLLKSSVLIALLMTAITSNAQEASEDTYWSRLDLKFDKGIQEVTSKFDGYESSAIKFNDEFVKIKVFKKVECAAGMICPQVAVLPVIVKLQVVKKVISQCYDSYYAKTFDNVKSAEYEQVIVHRFASERCQTIQIHGDGYVHYKITGLSSATDEAVSGHAFAKLVNVKKIEKIVIDDPVIPTPVEQ